MLYQLEHCQTVDPKKVSLINVSFKNLTLSNDEFYEFTSVYKIDVSNNYLNLGTYYLKRQIIYKKFRYLHYISSLNGSQCIGK